MGAALPAAKSQRESKLGFISSVDTATCKGHICLDSCCYTGEQIRSFMDCSVQNKTKFALKQIAACSRNKYLL